ncbi:MAG: hypothetical protein E6H52_16920 [Betaproteobacteria bacterium]|nr:MAG: hypothetical protein E6H52_16920 [Betaproteobacteria bacterium]
MNSRNWKWLAVLASLGALNAAYAQVEQPSGTIEIASTSVAAGVGVVWGNGTLHYRDANYGFSIQGLSVVDVGISSITTTGEVFDLKNPGDLEGNYVAGAAGLALAGGGDGIIMQNDRGVVLRLHGTEKGVRFQLGAQGVSIKLKS